VNPLRVSSLGSCHSQLTLCSLENSGIMDEIRKRLEPAFQEKLMSVLDKLKALDEERAKLLDDAKKEALAAAHKALADLNELGFDYRLVEGTGPPNARRPPREHSEGEAPKRQVRDIPCPICEFKTEPHHDGRAHRSQEPKKPFTEEELSEKGLAKVA
jgi:hypothetical protein